MRVTYDPALKANLSIDEAGRIRAINHLDEYREIEHRSGRDAAIAYVRDIAANLNIAGAEVRNLEQFVSYVDPQPQDVEYRFTDEKHAFDSTTFAFYQTFLNTPVWAAGVTATVKQAPARIVAATDTSEQGIDAKMPSAEAVERFRRLFATGEKVDGPARRIVLNRATEANLAGGDSALLTDILGKAGTAAGAPSEPRANTGANAAATTDTPNQSLRLIRGRFFVYRYDSGKRIDDHAHVGASTNKPKRTPSAEREDQPLCGTPPTLPLPPVPKAIEEGRWYVVAELVFRLPYQGSRMNWRMLVDVETNAILYLRALSSGVNGLVFTYDPISSTGTTTNTPNQSNAVLNPFRDDVTLLGLNAPVAGTQFLQGSLATLVDNSIPTVAPPTRPSGTDFDYDVRTNNFAAVNAYYHVDRFFRLVTDLGFPLGTYFNGTAFPVEVDHRGKGTAENQGNIVNADCIGDGDGIDYTRYALADTADTVNPMGIAADWRVVLHELGGHGVLYDHVGSANFGFSHSAGDSFAVILNDYLSEWHNGAGVDRFLLSPFVPSVPRRSDRTVASGWGWGGANDVGGYSSEQILSTTMFRIYRSIGGDSTHINRREFAARYMAYWMLRAIGTLSPMSNPASPTQFLSAMLTADALNWTSEGYFGGAYGKVCTWSFEKQNLNSGAVPPVDVYIDDSRAGEYQYLPVHWATTTIWNRRNSDGGTTHEEPALGETNYAYVKIKNRGSSTANNVIVKGFHCKPSAGVLWPNDLQPMTTTQLSAGSLNANNTQEKTVGPFEWTPVNNAWGHDCMMMIVSATGDPSNIDNFTAGEVVEDWRLVPNDNNVGQRNVTLVPGGGGIKGLVAGLKWKGFWIGNPGRRAATIAVSVSLPPVLASRGWRISVREVPEVGVRLKAREQKLVTFEVHEGAPFTKADIHAATERDIVVTATADGAIVGGMVYHVDPELEMPYNDLTPEDRKEGCRDKAKQLLDCLNLPGGKVKKVCVRKVALDIEMESDCGCD
jgi:zinc metalloprotease ZmpB